MLDSRLEHNLHIFVNSVEFIAKVIDLAKLTPNNVKVVCSTSGENSENNQRKLGKDYPIGQPSDPVRKINFYTSTCLDAAATFAESCGFTDVRIVDDLAGRPRVLTARKPNVVA